MTQTTHAAPAAASDLSIANNPDRRLRTVSSMMAWRVHEYGPPDVMKFERIPRPDPGRGEVLVKVEAAGVGPWDGWIRAGKGALPQPLPLTLGSDLAGEVVAVGPGVSRPRVGEQIYGVTNSRFVGAYAEYALASAAMVASKPASLSYIEAAGVPVVAVTARQALFDHGQAHDGANRRDSWRRRKRWSLCSPTRAPGRFACHCDRVGGRCGSRSRARRRHGHRLQDRAVRGQCPGCRRCDRSRWRRHTKALVPSPASRRQADFGGLRSRSRSRATAWRRSRILSGRGDDRGIGRDCQAHRRWKAPNRGWRGPVPRRCASRLI